MSGTDYFTYTDLVAGTTARASDVNNRMSALQVAFGKLPLPDKLQQGRSTAVQDLGSINSLAVALDFAPASYVFGLEMTVLVGNTNTGPSTVNVNGLGNKAVLRADGSALRAGDLTSGRIVHLVYDGSNFQILGASESVALAAETAAAASAASAASSATTAFGYQSAAATSAANAAASATAAAASAAAAATTVTGYLPLAGGIMTGPLTLAGAPTSNLHAATKKYVDDIAIAAGSFTADGSSITLSGGQFSLTTIATARLFGNVSGSTAKPGALTGTQATALLDLFSSSAKGLVGSPGASNGRVLKDDGSWTNDVQGNSATATKLASARTIAISGAVTGTGTAFDGSGNITIPISALDVGAATTGVLAVARGGTGVTTSTGSGSVVLAASPSLSGSVNLVGSLIVSSGGVSLASNGGSLYFTDASGSHPYLVCQGDNNFALYSTNSDGSQRGVFGVIARSNTAPATFYVPVVGPTPAAADNSTLLATTAFVQGELANYSKALLTVEVASSDYTLVNGHNNHLHQLTGSTPHTITAGTVNNGLSLLIINTGTANWTFSCAGGVYLDGATSTTTSATIPGGARCTAIHLGGGVWMLSGV